MSNSSSKSRLNPVAPRASPFSEMATRARRSTRLEQVSTAAAASQSAPAREFRVSDRSQAKSNKPTPTVGTNTNKKGENANTNESLRIDLHATNDSPSKRPSRERKQRTNYSPTEAVPPTRAYRRRVTAPGAEADVSPDEQCRRLEGRVRSQVKQLRYLQTFLEAYEAEGWRRASREKLKPSKELEVARRKMVKTKRRVVDTLQEILTLKQRDPQIPYLKEIEERVSDDDDDDSSGVEAGHDGDATEIYCSRCSLTDTTEENDILLCDNVGCFRAFHQHCQVPAVSTDDIPPGDEPWFCASCLAIFNSLKLINYACDTTYENVEDVFTELAEEEQSLIAGGDGDYSTAEGTAEEREENTDDDDDDEDEDFSISVKDADSGGGSSVSSSSDSEAESADTSADDGVLESDVSEDELKHLHKDDVIDQNRRSSRSTSTKTSAETWLGRRVAKQNGKEDDDVTMGVIVEMHERESDSTRLWRVVYYDDTTDLLDAEAAAKGMELAEHHESKAATAPQDSQEVDRSLIIRGKRKRTRVDYRALNDLLFDGKEDSDVGDDESHDDSAGEDDGNAGEQDDEDYAPDTAEEKDSEDAPAKRGRRARHKVDYRAMHEGVVSF